VPGADALHADYLDRHFGEMVAARLRQCAQGPVPQMEEVKQEIYRRVLVAVATGSTDREALGAAVTSVCDALLAGPVDALLIPLIVAHDEARADDIAARLMTQETLPLVSRLVGRKMWGIAVDAQDASDVETDVALKLWVRLLEHRTNPAKASVRSWSSYVMQTTHHAWSNYLRHKRPARHRLKNKVRYVVTSNAEFALWEVGHELRCGRRAWQGIAHVAEGYLHGDRSWRPGFEPSSREATPAELARLLDHIFSRVDGPLALDTLAAMVAEVWPPDSDLPVSVDEPSIAAVIAAPGATTDVTMRWREVVEFLWREIGELPIEQRRALLLNLRSEQEFPAIEVFAVAGVASVRQIAQALDESPAEFARLWPTLPIDDAAIARKLGVPRQRVINLRKSARDRLSRKLKRKFGAVGNIR
jgi:hypothetical protein